MRTRIQSVATVVFLMLSMVGVLHAQERPTMDEVRARAAEIVAKKQAEEAKKVAEKADEEAQKAWTPEERQAFKELRREAELRVAREKAIEDRAERLAKKAAEDVAKAEQTEANAKARAGLTCMSQADYDRVWVDPRAVSRTFGFVHSRMTMVNMTTITVRITQIEGGGGVVVRNMCPGGSLSLIQMIGFNGQNQVAYSASPEPENEQVGMRLSPRIYLQGCQSSSSCREEYAEIWNIAQW